MPDHVEPSLPTGTLPGRPHRLRFWLAILALLSLVGILFEVGVRHVPPDGMTVTFLSAGGRPLAEGSWVYTAPKDQQIIAAWYAGLNTAPVESQTSTSYAVDDGCYPTAYPQITFTWHGIPVEAWTSHDSISICEYIESAGGLSENLTRTFHLWFPTRIAPPAASRAGLLPIGVEY